MDFLGVPRFLNESENRAVRGEFIGWVYNHLIRSNILSTCLQFNSFQMLSFNGSIFGDSQRRQRLGNMARETLHRIYLHASLIAFHVHTGKPDIYGSYMCFYMYVY